MYSRALTQFSLKKIASLLSERRLKEDEEKGDRLMKKIRRGQKLEGCFAEIFLEEPRVTSARHSPFMSNVPLLPRFLDRKTPCLPEALK